MWNRYKSRRYWGTRASVLGLGCDCRPRRVSRRFWMVWAKLGSRGLPRFPWVWLGTSCWPDETWGSSRIIRTSRLAGNMLDLRKDKKRSHCETSLRYFKKSLFFIAILNPVDFHCMYKSHHTGLEWHNDRHFIFGWTIPIMDSVYSSQCMNTWIFLVLALEPCVFDLPYCICWLI